MEHVIGRHKAERVGEARERVCLPMRAAHAASHQDVESLQLSLRIRHHHKAHVVRKHIHRVVARDRHRDLELAGQEQIAIDGLWRVLKVCPKAVEGPIRRHLGILHLVAEEFLPVQPHIVVRAALRRQQVGDIVRVLLSKRIVGPALCAIHRRRCHHVPIHIPARPQRTPHVLYHTREDRLEILLQHAVQLKRLPRRQPQRPVPIQIGQLIHHQVELVRHRPSRLARTHHKLIRLALAGTALLPVILLV
mmetsp:Transcript_14292/g.40781  ORF Transcript_14292/g.40781 Transcript_14292/m.40781 type:complete len:249 (+) Transcript_14292:1091-1837(+)